LAPAISAEASLTPAAGSLTLTGLAPVASAGAALTPAVGSLTLTGLAPLVEITDSTDLLPAAGTLAFSGLAPGVTADADLLTVLGLLTFSADPISVTTLGARGGRFLLTEQSAVFQVAERGQPASQRRGIREWQSQH
jgi:hypothetical protein